MRKFKHVGREDCFAVPHENKRNPVNYDIWVGEVQRGTVPHWIVENYTDWQEITPELVEGRWYVTVSGKPFRFTKTNGNEVYGDNFVGNYIVESEEKVITDKEQIEREATKEEIHKALETIRIEKGLVEGAKFKIGPANIQLTLPTKYDAESDILKDGRSYAIYSNGAWIDKLSEPILVTEDLQNFKQDFWDQFNKLCDKYFGHE